MQGVLPLGRRFGIAFILLASGLCLGGALAAGPFSLASTITKLDKRILPVAYRIDLKTDIPGAHFSGAEQIDVDVQQAADTITLNARGLTIAAARLLGTDVQDAVVTLDAEAETATLRFPHALTLGRHTLSIAYSGPISGKSHSGIFYTDYSTPRGTRRMLATQFEFTAARTMFPSWDEPVFKAPFTFSAIVPKKLAVISNTPITREEPAGIDGSGVKQKKVTFETTPKMSSYLAVLLAGELDAVRDAAAGVKIGVWTTAGHSAEGTLALQTAKAFIPYYGDYFGIGYPLPKLDMVAVPDLGFNAMENWGGITFTEGDVLFDEAHSSEAQRQWITHIVGHEVAHQWFGDLVTTASWDDVWLNESFADWMSYKAGDYFHPQWQVWLRSHADKKRAMSADVGGNTKPVQSSFDANISYRKGPQLIRMIESYLGEDAFRSGMRQYMKAHAYSNATTADLWAALQLASGKPVAAIAGSFTEQPGVPLIRVSTRCENDETVATLTQSRLTVPGIEAVKLTWQVPVVMATVGGASAAPAHTVIVGSSPATLRFPGCTQPVKANLGDVGYYHTAYNESNLKALTASYRRLTPADRVNLLGDQWALVQTGQTDVRTYLNLTRELSEETELVVWTDVLQVLREIDALERGLTEREEFQGYARKLLQPLMNRLGWDRRDGEDAENVLLRADVIAALGQFRDPAVLAESKRRFARFVAKPDSLSPSLRDAVLENVGRSADLATYQQLHSLAKAATSRDEKSGFYTALASAQDPALIDETIKLASTNEITGMDLAMLLINAARRGDPDQVWRGVESHRQAITTSAVGSDNPGGFLSALAEHSSNPAIAKEVVADPAFAASSGTIGPVLSIARQAELRTRVAPGVSQWLKEQIAKVQ